jgi:arginase
MLASLGWRVEDTGDVDFEAIASKWRGTEDLPNARNCGIVGSGNEHLANIVEQVVLKGHFPLILGGDHSIGIGSLAGILRAQPNTGILWIDAHADLNTPVTSESGNMHGMPVGMIMEGVAPDHKELPGLEWLADGPRLKSDSIVYVGLRDVDAAERSAIRELGIQVFTMYDIDHLGIGQVMDLALKHLLEHDPNRPLHLSYDIDAIDPHFAPATGTAVRGGLTFREAHFVAEFAAQSGNLASAEIVELNHTLSDGVGAKDTVDLGLQVVTSMMGKSII